MQLESFICSYDAFRRFRMMFYHHITAHHNVAQVSGKLARIWNAEKLISVQNVTDKCFTPPILTSPSEKARYTLATDYAINKSGI